jgi:hypothetical protein
MTISTEILRYQPELDRFEARLDELDLTEPPKSFHLVNPKTGSRQEMKLQQILYEGKSIKSWTYVGSRYTALILSSRDEVK